MVDIDLTKSQIELLRQMVYTGNSPRFSIEQMDEKEQKNAKRRIRRLAETLSEAGVSLKEIPEQSQYWFDFRDLYEAGLRELIQKEKEKDTVMLYITPGHLGLGTKLFDPVVAEGLNIFLRNYTPFLGGKPISQSNAIESIDAVVFLGGLIPEVPYNAMSSNTTKKIAVLAQLTPEEMSQARRESESTRLEQIASSEHLSEEVKKRYQREAFGTIISLEEGALKAKTTLETMLSGYKGPIFYQTGNEDLANAKTIQRQMETEIKKYLSDINRQRSKIKQILAGIESSKERRILAQNVGKVIEDMDSYIFSEENIEWLREEYGLTERHLKSDPRKAAYRRPFEILKDKFIEKKKEEIDNQGFPWEEDSFGDMNEQEIAGFKTKHEAEIIELAKGSMDIIRTYYGLGWQMALPQKKTDAANAAIARGKTKNQEAEEYAGLDLKMLHLLGWVGETSIKEATISDAQLLRIRAQEKMADIYRQAAGSFDLRVLGEGTSDISINGFTFIVEYSKNNPDGDSKISECTKRASEAGMHNEFIPDGYIMGPAGKMIVRKERKRPHEYAEGPVLAYLTDNESVIFIQTANMYSEHAIKEFQEMTSEEKRDGRTPKEHSSGQIALHVLGKDSDEHHFDVVNVDDLRDVALFKKGVLQLMQELKRKRNSQEIESMQLDVQKKERMIIYRPEISIVTMDDYHFGDSDPYLQDSAAMFRRAAIMYLEKTFGYPDILKLSEMIDGAQTVKGVELACQHNVFSENQIKKALENISRSNIPDSKKVVYLEEMIRMAAEGMARPTVDEQMEELLLSEVGEYIKNVVAKGGEVIAIGGDHPGRTVKHRGDEATKLRNGYQQCFVKGPDGNEIRVAEKIMIGNQGEISGHHFYRGTGKKEGINLYSFHKGDMDLLKQLRGFGSNVKAALAGHRHHLEVVIAGGQGTFMPPGMVPPYNYVYEKGLRPSLQGILRITFPEQNDTLYERSVSFDIASNLALERADPEFHRRKELRKEVLQYIPPK